MFDSRIFAYDYEFQVETHLSSRIFGCKKFINSSIVKFFPLAEINKFSDAEPRNHSAHQSLTGASRKIDSPQYGKLIDDARNVKRRKLKFQNLFAFQMSEVS